MAFESLGEATRKSTGNTLGRAAQLRNRFGEGMASQANVRFVLH